MNNSAIFPVGIPATWTSPEQTFVPDAYLKNWLLDTGSLTERLQSHCRRFSLSLLGQRQLPIELEEYQHVRDQSDDASQGNWQVREVILHGDDCPWVFARSILPDSLCQEDFSGLGEKPLGQVIFNDARFKRSPFQLTRLLPGDGFLARLGQADIMPLWGRRSVFTYRHYSMMVAEVFLPGSPAYKQLPNPYPYE